MNLENRFLRRGDIVILKPGTARGRFRLTTPTLDDAWLAINLQTDRPCRVPVGLIDWIERR